MILEQAVINTVPAVSSVYSGLHFLRSFMAQCEQSCSGEVGGSASGAGVSGSASSTTSLSTPPLALLVTQRALWHPQCKKLESNLQVLLFYWPYNQQYPWLTIAMVQLSSDSV